jgi:hypothetical protein
MIASAGALDVLTAWVQAHPQYAYTAAATEPNASGVPTEATLRITYDATTHVATVHVIAGRMAGTDVTWAGGPTVAVRAPGLAHLVSVKLPLRDPRMLSPQGNDIRAAIFGNVAECFVADASHLHVNEDGNGTFTLIDDAPSCTAGYGDDHATSDRLTIDATTGRPLLRERFDGSTMTGHWAITALQE